MHLIFCADPLNVRIPDPDYMEEVNAAKLVGIDYSLINFEALVRENNPRTSVIRVALHESLEVGIYRGWMLKPIQYAQLYDALLERGIRLINDPAAYKHCHYLPESYSIIADYTPRSIWLRNTGNINFDQLMSTLQPFGDKPIVVKDFVKSQKHYWHEAFYIPSALNRDSVERVVYRFLELQGEDLNEGLVFREFVEFEPIGKHSSGMPLTREYRLFFLEGNLLYFVNYWPGVNYSDLAPPIDFFQAIAKRIKSQFFTMDVAQCASGDWMIVELGDGQVAGLPENSDPLAFYNSLKGILNHS